MGLFNRKKQQEDEFDFETSDFLVVFDDDKKTSDIRTISYIDEESVCVHGSYKVPLDDCEITTGQEGRNFFYRAPSQSIRETERLAKLEKSMVLQQITAYKPPVPPTNMDWTKGLLFGLIFIAFIVIGISSCAK
jgi:hypothetical protein